MATKLLSILKLADQYAFQLVDGATSILAVKPAILDVALIEQLDQFSILFNGLLAERQPLPLRPGEVDPFSSLCRLLYTQMLPPEIRNGLEAFAPGTALSIFTNDPALPWDLLHDGEDHLALRYSVARSLPTNMLRRSTAPTAEQSWSALLIGNPTSDLPSAAEEIEQIARLVEATPGASVAHILMRTRATKDAVRRHLAGGAYRLIHYAGHAYIDRDAPERSGLLLANQEILTIREIQEHIGGQPFVFLNGCESAHKPKAGGPVDQTHAADIAAAFMRAGAQAVVGTFWPVHDKLSAALAVAFYRVALHGEPYAVALRTARLESRRLYRQAPLWAAYQLYGDPTQALATQYPKETRAATVMVACLVADRADRAAIEMAPTYVHAVSACAERFGGRVVSVANLEVMVVFGLEAIQTNDAERALHAGILLREMMAAHPTPYPCSIGVSSGEVLVFPLQQTVQSLVAVAGQPVEDARRLVVQASPGTCLVDEHVRRLTRRDFILTRAPRTLTSTGSSSFCYLVAGRRPESDSGESDFPDDVAFAGRRDELVELQESWHKCRQGEGKVLDLIGGPGMGKSRLIREFRREVTADVSVFWCTVNCPSTYAPSAYWLVGQLLRRLFGLTMAMSEAQAWRCVEEIAQDAMLADAGAREAFSLIGDLLELKRDGTAMAMSDIGAQRRKLAKIVRHLLVWRTAIQPVIVVIDNGQWADEASLELLAAFTKAAEDLSVLWLVTLPTYATSPTPWRDQNNYRAIKLRELEETDSAALLATLLDSRSLDVQLQQIVLPAARGNPLFLREFVASLTEAGILQRREGVWRLTRLLARRDVPDTIQRVIRLRIEALSDAAQQVLSVLAVCGEYCESGLIEMVLQDTGRQLDVGLAELEARELIQRRWEDDAYVFTHGLIQEEVYHALLGEERRRYHRRIGRALEMLYVNQIEGVLDRLSHHFFSAVTASGLLGGSEMVINQADAGDLEKAMVYWGRAGDQANRRLAARQAIECYDRALLVADALARHQPVERTAYFVGKGEAADLLGDFETAVAHYHSAFAEALATAASHDARRTAADLARRTGRLLGKLGRYAEAHHQMEQALQILGEVDEEADLTVAALVHTHSGSLYYLEDRFDDAELACRRALAMLGAWEHGSVTATAQNVLGVVCEITGRWPEALDNLENSRQLWQTLDDRHQQALVSDNLATLYFYRGDFEDAAAIYRQNLAFWETLEAIDEAGYATLNLGSIFLARGLFDVAAEHDQRALTAFERTKNSKLLALARNNLGFLALAQGRPEDAHGLFEASAAADPNAENHRGLAEAEIILGRWDVAQAFAEQALALARAASMAVEEGAALRVMGLLHSARSDLAGARRFLESSRDLLRKLGARYELARTLTQLASLLERIGEPDAASVREEADALFTAVGVRGPSDGASKEVVD